MGDDPLFHAIIERGSGRAVGMASYLRIDAANGVIEVGHLNFSPALQRTPAATEAMYLMMRRVFDELGYRRYEWKCDALNAASRAAALRLGFRFEGIFRQAVIYKGRSRDTAWFSVIDREWPALRTVFEHWLRSRQFRRRRAPARAAFDPDATPELSRQDLQHVAIGVAEIAAATAAAVVDLHVVEGHRAAAIGVCPRS